MERCVRYVLSGISSISKSYVILDIYVLGKKKNNPKIQLFRLWPRLVYNSTTRRSTNSPGVEVRIPGFGQTHSIEFLDTHRLAGEGKQLTCLCLLVCCRMSHSPQAGRVGNDL